MPGTVSNPATLQSVINVFGSGGSPINLFAYRRGAGVVPNNAAYNGVSTTEPALSTFAGLVYPVTPNLPDFGSPGAIVLDKSVTATVPGRIGAGVIISLFSDGTGEYASDDTESGDTILLSFNWRPSGFDSTPYFAYMDSPTGDPFSAGSSAQDTSLPLTTSRSWTLRAVTLVSNPSVSKGLFSTPGLRIKDSAGNDLISKTVTMSVSVNEV